MIRQCRLYMYYSHFLFNLIIFEQDSLRKWRLNEHIIGISKASWKLCGEARDNKKILWEFHHFSTKFCLHLLSRSEMFIHQYQDRYTSVKISITRLNIKFNYILNHARSPSKLLIFGIKFYILLIGQPTNKAPFIGRLDSLKFYSIFVLSGV